MISCLRHPMSDRSKSSITHKPGDRVWGVHHRWRQEFQNSLIQTRRPCPRLQMSDKGKSLKTHTSVYRVRVSNVGYRQEFINLQACRLSSRHPLSNRGKSSKTHKPVDWFWDVQRRTEARVQTHKSSNQVWGIQCQIEVRVQKLTSLPTVSEVSNVR